MKTEDTNQEINEKSFKCNICSLDLKTVLLLRNHVKQVHVKREKITCDVCDKPMSCKNNLKRHFDTFHVKKESSNFSCEICQEQFTNQQKFLDHCKNNHRNKSVKCNLCNKWFVSNVNLLHHVEAVHEKLKKNKCETCQKVFYEKGNLKKHIKLVHEDKENHSCEICGKTFCNEIDMKRHVKLVHESQKLRKCDICGQSYKTSLQKHIDIVHKERNAKCDTCAKEYCDMDNLKRHVETVHNKKKKLECEICLMTMTFAYKNTYQRHMYRSHNVGQQKILQCEQCEKSYSDKSNLIRHTKSAHSKISK